MPLDIDRFIVRRPRLYHLTAAANAERILETRTMRAAAVLLRQAGRHDVLRNRRAQSIWIDTNGQRTHIRDQSPLHRGNVTLDPSWQFEDFVECLNQHVYFWPGTDSGPISHGYRHFQRYARENALVLEFNTQELFRANPTPGPKFCKYNSGSPRCTKGKGSPRGPLTFAHAPNFSYRPSEVVEVTFSNDVCLSECAVMVHKIKDFVD